MKFVVQSKAFYNAASAVGKVISSKNALIILDNFLLELKDSKLTLTGSDTDSTLSAGIELSDSEGEGKICLSSRTLSNLLKELPDQEVTFNINDSTLEVEITYPGGTFNLVGINGNEFPEYRAPEDQAEPVKIVTEGKRISKAFDYTLFAVATEDFRAQMQGVYFDIFDPQARALHRQQHKARRKDLVHSASEGSLDYPQCIRRQRNHDHGNRQPLGNRKRRPILLPLQFYERQVSRL